MTFMPTVRLEADVFEALKKLAEPLVDTPSSVVRRLLEEKGLLDRAMKLKPNSGAGSTASGLTPQLVFEDYLLKVLDTEFGGRGDKRNVTQAVLERMRADGLITAADLELVATGETKAENAVSWGRNALKERGYIAPPSRRGIWELTSMGRAAARQVLPSARPERRATA
jgi:hypothetical protein